MLMSFKQRDENVNEWLSYFLCLSIVSIDYQDGVNDSNVSTNERIFFFFVCQVTHKNAYKCH